MQPPINTGAKRRELVAWDHPGCAGDDASPDSHFGLDLTDYDFITYRRIFAERRVPIVLDLKLTAIERRDNHLTSRFIHNLTGAKVLMEADQIIIEHGTTPVDDLFHELRGYSRNLGQIDIDALLDGSPECSEKNQCGTFELYRVGDAVASRDIHAAMLDSLHLCSSM